ncbi:MAG: glycosyl transferase [Anaerolineae bacterium]|nr:glycosyl transferase [Anaerolineae bacterium]
MTNYGYFDDDRREYVITNPKTPVKWINYIGGLSFGGFVDHTGGLLICKGDPSLNRITKYIPQMPASDFKGATLYLRLREETGYKTFSPFFTPTLDNYDLYECYVGLGYSRIVSEFYGIRMEATIFVPTGEDVVVQAITITNIGQTAREIDAIPVVEYTHFDALKQFTNADWIPQTMTSQVVAEADGRKILIEYPFMLRDMRINYFTSSHPVSSFETDRKKFLGDNEYGTWANPLSLQQPELSNYEAVRGDIVGALLHHLGVLQPGASAQFTTLLGQAENVAAAQPLIAKYRDPQNVTAALQTMAAFWDNYLNKFQVNTPDASMNAILNVHNPRQCYITLNWSRYLSLYQLGLGSRGIGFRDSSQDVLGVLAAVPDEGVALIRKLLSTQKRNGSAMHQFNPLTMIAEAGEATDDDRPTYYSDDHLWIILAVTAYLKETGDMAFLHEEIPFYDKDKKGQPIETGSVWEHLRRAVQFTHGDRGQHSLPLAGFADWNDTVNLRKGAESLFTANLYGRALLDLITLAHHLQFDEAAAEFQAQYDEMKEIVNRVGWDGRWYVRYFDYDGSPLGSHTNEQGQIYANGQSWPVLSGFAEGERARLALDAVHEHLNTAHGIKLSTPGFNGFDPSKGGVTTYPPGAKENGGIFLHANPWVMIAKTLLGDGDRAYAYYRQINPAAKNEIIDLFEVEPYAYPQNILGDEHPQHGLGRNSWLTGTASWTYQAGTQWILGIRPDYDGLVIDPCIPKAWDGFTAVRHFRHAIYHITVENPTHICKGVKSMTVDGQPVAGQTAPVFEDGQIHQVQVILGA